MKCPICVIPKGEACAEDIVVPERPPMTTGWCRRPKGHKGKHVACFTYPEDTCHLIAVSKSGEEEFLTFELL